MSRQLHLNANVIPSGRHAAAWRLRANPCSVVDIGSFLDIARIAERGTLDALFFADHSSLDASARDRPWQALDPAIVLPAMAAVTERIGLDATASTTFEHPFHVARRFDSLDHVSKGRAAWNIVTSPTRGFIENIVREANREGLTVRQVLCRNPFGGHRMIVGTPEQIADNMEVWFHSRAADGFNLNMDAYPSGLELFVDQVVPELRRRGLFRYEYTGTMLRDHLGLSRPPVTRPLANVA